MGTSSLDLVPLGGHAPPITEKPRFCLPTPKPQTLNYTLESSGPAQPIRNSCSLGCCYRTCSQRGPESQFCSNCFLASNRSRDTVCALGLEFVWVPMSETLVNFSIWVQCPDLKLQVSELAAAQLPNSVCANPKSRPFAQAGVSLQI